MGRSAAATALGLWTWKRKLMTDAAQKPIVVGLGELLWDCFEDSRRPGGAPANVAFHAQQLGARGVVCSRVGRDALGDELAEYLQSHGLDVGWVQRDDVHPTGTVTVDSTDSSHPQYVIHENVAWDHLQFDEATKSLMHRASAVCFGTLAQRKASSRATIHSCLAATSADCLRVYDVNLRQHWYEREWVERSIEFASIVKLNNDEVVTLSELLELPSDFDEFAAGVEARWGSRLVCVTRGERGCLLFQDGRRIEAEGEAVQVADAVGAGDAFTAALITARLRGWSLENSATFANKVGGLVAGRPGAMPDLKAEVVKLMEQFS